MHHFLSSFSELTSYAHTGQGHCSVLYECLDLLAVLGVVVEVQTGTCCSPLRF